jgi:hypothetical protein
MMVPAAVYIQFIKIFDDVMKLVRGPCITDYSDNPS